LFALADTLANFVQQLVLPKPVQSWTLTTIKRRQQLQVIGFERKPSYTQ
jgi:hypothetical protein